MTLHHLNKILVLSFITIIVSACTGTKLQDTWQAEEFSKSSFDNVLVVALTSNKTHRLLFENSFVEEFERKGVKSKASHEIIGTAYPTREDVEVHAKSGEYTYVAVVRMGGLDVEKDYVPPKSVTYYNGPFYPRYYDQWNGIQGVTLTQEGYTDVRTEVLLTTSIYDVKSEDLMWVGRSKSFDSSSVANVGAELAAKVASHITR